MLQLLLNMCTYKVPLFICFYSEVQSCGTILKHTLPYICILKRNKATVTFTTLNASFGCLLQLVMLQWIHVYIN